MRTITQILTILFVLIGLTLLFFFFTFNMMGDVLGAGQARMDQLTVINLNLIGSVLFIGMAVIIALLYRIAGYLEKLSKDPIKKEETE